GQRAGGGRARPRRPPAVVSGEDLVLLFHRRLGEALEEFGVVLAGVRADDRGRGQVVAVAVDHAVQPDLLALGLGLHGEGARAVRDLVHVQFGDLVGGGAAVLQGGLVGGALLGGGRGLQCLVGGVGGQRQQGVREGGVVAAGEDRDRGRGLAHLGQRGPAVGGVGALRLVQLGLLAELLGVGDAGQLPVGAVLAGLRDDLGVLVLDELGLA